MELDKYDNQEHSNGRPRLHRLSCSEGPKSETRIVEFRLVLSGTCFVVEVLSLKSRVAV